MQSHKVAVVVVVISVSLSCDSKDGDTDSGPAAGDQGGADSASLDASPGDTVATKDTTTKDSGAAKAFTFLKREVVTKCPEPAFWCKAHWPKASDGVVYRYSSREVYKGKTWTRTFYVYKSKRVTGKVPLLLYLHGGGGRGLLMMSVMRFSEMADSRGAPGGAGVSWRRNTALCTYTHGKGYVTAAGKTCIAPKVTFHNKQPFIYVMPEGVLDKGSTTKRHWEDGRVTSPGFDTVAQHRDDVGFIDHVIHVLLTREKASVDPERVYLGGSSNGGMMTQRVICNVDNPAYKRLRRIAAFTPVVATLPEALFDGKNGREKCPKKGKTAVAVAYFVGNKIPTPNCKPFPCQSNKVSGDGLMPFGEKGKRYYVWSPDAGKVVSAPDAHQHWVSYNTNSTANPGIPQSVKIGKHTVVTRYTFGGKGARVTTVIADGGHHLELPTLTRGRWVRTAQDKPKLLVVVRRGGEVVVYDADRRRIVDRPTIPVRHRQQVAYAWLSPSGRYLTVGKFSLGTVPDEVLPVHPTTRLSRRRQPPPARRPPRARQTRGHHSCRRSAVRTRPPRAPTRPPE